MKEGRMERKPIKEETKANRQETTGGEEEVVVVGGDGAGRGGLAGGFIKKRAGGEETREAWFVTKPVNYTPIMPRPWRQNPRVTCQAERKKKQQFGCNGYSCYEGFELQSGLSWVKERPWCFYPRCIAKKLHFTPTRL